MQLYSEQQHIGKYIDEQAPLMIQACRSNVPRVLINGVAMQPAAAMKSIDIATEAEPQASPAEARRTQHDNRISSSTKQLVRKMIFPLMTVIYTICICLLSKEGVEIYFHESHRFYGSKGDRYLKRRWKETFVSGHSRCLSPRFYFMRTTLERLFQTYY